MSECILKSEVSSLQTCLKSFSSNFKLIDDDKLVRNILKRKSNDQANQKNTKRQKI